MSNNLIQIRLDIFVRFDLGPNCLQMLSADGTSEQRVSVKGEKKKVTCPHCLSDLN